MELLISNNGYSMLFNTDFFLQSTFYLICEKNSLERSFTIQLFPHCQRTHDKLKQHTPKISHQKVVSNMLNNTSY